MPRILPIGGRGPYAVGIATEHIRTPVATVGEADGNTPSEGELWPLELMAQVGYCCSPEVLRCLGLFPLVSLKTPPGREHVRGISCLLLPTAMLACWEFVRRSAYCAHNLVLTVCTAAPAQVFYPVDKSCVEKLPWFPSSIEHFRRSLAPATGEARRTPFGLTLVSARETKVRLDRCLGDNAKCLPHLRLVA